MNSKPLAFLEAILPDEGYKVAAVFEGKQVRHFFFTATSDLADFISREDALGKTTYHACASFSTKDNRKKPNACRVQALWADVDAGDGKPYVDAVAAAQAVSRFCRSAGFPPPIYVGSGYGVHVYWPLVEALEPDEWLGYATALRHLCHRHDLQIDGSRAADISSILRTPGTHNRKGDVERIVQCGPIVGPYAIEELGELSVAQTHVVRGLAAGSRASLVAAAVRIYGATESSVEPIRNECHQVALLHDAAGTTPEPHWYAVLGVLAHCADGEEQAHDWSSGYDSYTFEETQSRLDRAKTFGPTTCAHFEKINPSGCEGCYFKNRITSPIQLGKNTENTRPTSEKANGHHVEIEAPPEVILLPEGYEWRGKRLVFTGENNEGKDNPLLLSEYPLYLHSVQTGEINNESFSLQFHLELPNEERRNIVLPAETFFGAQGLSKLAGRGAIIHEPEQFRHYTRHAVDAYNAKKRLEMQYAQFGWKDETSFLYGANLYTPSSIAPAIGSDEVKHRSQYLGPTKGGSLERWSRAANSLFAKGCEPQSFALLASFAAPLMRFHSSGEGGAIISLVNDQSGSGKTTALEAVASVWGREEGVKLTDDDTKVAKSLSLGVLGNLPCVFDELYNRDPEVIRQFVLMFTNGRDKMRGTRDGEIRHSKASWQTLLVLASNLSIVDILSNVDGTDAPAFRLLEFSCSIPRSIASRGDALKRELKDNSGWAGDAYLRRLVQPETLAFIKQALPKWTEEVWKQTGLENEHRFWVRTIASTIAAGFIVQKMGILDFSPQRITHWVMDHVKERKNNGTITGHRDSVSMLSEYMHEHMNDVLVVAKEWKAKDRNVHPLIMPKRKLVMRYETENGRLYISESHMRKWLVEKGLNIREFFGSLTEKGIVTRLSRKMTLGAGTEYATGQVPCVEIYARHPTMSGVLQPVDTVAEDVKPRLLQRV